LSDLGKKRKIVSVCSVATGREGNPLDSRIGAVRLGTAIERRETVSTSIDLGQGAEVRIAGSTVGVLLPEDKYRELITERDSLRRELEEARQVSESLRQQSGQYLRQVKSLKAEIDRYEKALTAAVRDQFPSMDEETALALIAETEKTGVDFGKAVHELAAGLCKKDMEGRHAD
jgi:hypothetical protein